MTRTLVFLFLGALSGILGVYDKCRVSEYGLYSSNSADNSVWSNNIWWISAQKQHNHQNKKET